MSRMRQVWIALVGRASLRVKREWDWLFRSDELVSERAARVARGVMRDE